MILLNISNDRNQPDRSSYRDTQEKDSRLNIKKSSVEQISNLQLNAVVRSINFHDPNWHDARMREYHKFVTNEVFEVVPLPENVRLLPTKWVYTHKTTELKENAFKARCVVMGNRQIENLHYDPYRISLTVIDMATIRLLTAIAVEWAYNMHHIDIAELTLMHPLNPLTEQYIYVHHEDLTTTQLHVGKLAEPYMDSGRVVSSGIFICKNYYKRWALSRPNLIPIYSSVTTMVITYLWGVRGRSIRRGKRPEDI